MLNLDVIAAASNLCDESSVHWTDSDVPLCERGVRLEWLINFVRAVHGSWREVVSRYELQQRDSIRYDFAPWPDPLPYGAESDMTGDFVVNMGVKPLTVRSAAPLFARVDGRDRSRPDLFISHAWTNPLIGNAFSSLYALSPSSHPQADPFVWLDLICYNQHRAESIAADMKSVIASIGRVAMPMINAVPFTRLWCLWELLCAHIAGAAVELHEANGHVSDLGYVARVFEYEFVSVERASTTLAADRDQILAAMVATFGSIRATDEHVRHLVLSGLSRDSDKPWNRPRFSSPG